MIHEQITVSTIKLGLSDARSCRITTHAAMSFSCYSEAEASEYLDKFNKIFYVN